jgi:hydrogenase-4 component F
MNLYPAGAMVLLTGMVCILAIPPSGMFISELMIFRGLVLNNQWFVLIAVIVLLCFIIYAMSIRIMHITFSGPRIENDSVLPGKVNPAEAITQFVFFGIVIMMCFFQPPFLVDIIYRSFEMLPK